MGTRDPRVDAYIDNAAPFSQPILRHLREVIHEAEPAVEETIKWGFPHFQLQGTLCHMAAFKQHCAFGFTKGELVLPAENQAAANMMSSFGRLTAVADLPDRATLAAYVREAARLNREGVKVPKASAAKRASEVAIPEAFRVALEGNPAAAAAFAKFPPGYRREYLEWIAEAKKEETRDRRIATAIEWIAEGKPRNWKYSKC